MRRLSSRRPITGRRGTRHLATRLFRYGSNCCAQSWMARRRSLWLTWRLAGGENCARRASRKKRRRIWSPIWRRATSKRSSASLATHSTLSDNGSPSLQLIQVGFIRRKNNLVTNFYTIKQKKQKTFLVASFVLEIKIYNV